MDALQQNRETSHVRFGSKGDLVVGLI